MKILICDKTEKEYIEQMRAAQTRLGETRKHTVDLIRAEDPKAQTSDTNYIFLSFVLAHLPVGLIGLVFAAIFAASMNSTSSELNALASTTVIDVIRRIRPGIGEVADQQAGLAAVSGDLRRRNEELERH